MKMKASVDYGVRTVIYLAVKGETCSSREISEEMAVPRDYLIQLASKLRNAGLIKARPGKNGGYELAKSPDKISIGDMLNPFDSDLQHARRNMRKRRKSSKAALAVRDVHNVVMNSLDAYLEAVTVQDLVESMEEGKAPELLLADALEAEVARLRASAK